MTSVVVRMAALQCWAHPYKLYVVEPVVDNSHLVCPFSNNLSSDMTYLSDIFDLEFWNEKRGELSSAYKIWPFAPLVHWDSFVRCAPRKIIFVEVIHVAREERKSPCTSLNCRKVWKDIFKPLQFTVFQKVCIDLTDYPSIIINEAQFEYMVFKEYLKTSNGFTVVFEEWRGFLNKNSLEKNFIEVVDSPCTVSFTGKPAVQKHLKPSKHILSDAGNFVEKT